MQGKVSKVWFLVWERTLNNVPQNGNSRKATNAEGHECLPIGSNSTRAPADPPASLFLLLDPTPGGFRPAAKPGLAPVNLHMVCASLFPP